MATSNRTDSTIEIQLTKGQVAIIDIDDADLAELQWSALGSGVRGGLPYFVATRASKMGGKRATQYMHRVIMERVLGCSLASDEQVDHIDGDSLNNRRANLRKATNAQNQANRGAQANNTSGYKGVYWSKADRKWKAFIRVNKKMLHLGYFSKPEDAHKAYIDAAKKYFGEYARGSW